MLLIDDSVRVGVYKSGVKGRRALFGLPPHVNVLMMMLNVNVE